MIKHTKTFAVVLLLGILPGWLYASGNLPALPPWKEEIAKATTECFPRMAGATCTACSEIYHNLREAGISIPHTYNERLAAVAETRAKVITLCNQIISDR